MNISLQKTREPVVYPESDGLPMAENSVQFRWILVLFGNIAIQFREAADVLVCGDMFWYPVEGHPEIKVAPDVFVVFGRPKGDRGSYQQWKEGNLPLTVVFEVLSPSNTVLEMANKLAFYEEHGVEEYYVFDPERNGLMIYLRRGESLKLQAQAHGFISPRLRIRFDLSGPEMAVYRSDGQRFLTIEELETARLEAVRQAVEAQQQTARAQQQAEEAQQQTARAQQQAEEAQQQTARAEQQAEEAQQQTARAEQQAEEAQQQTMQTQQRAARLSQLARKVRQQQLPPEELAELERLENEFLRGSV